VERGRHRMKTKRKGALLVGASVYGAVFIAAAALGSMGYFHFGDPEHACNSCHEMNGVHSEWAASAHRTIHCRQCHGGSLTLNLHALQSHANRVVQHFSGATAESVQFNEQHALAAHNSCRTCHPQTFADWEASRHATTYAEILLNPAQNAFEHPAEDCLRCHGMFYQDGIESLVTPLNTVGPWSLLDPAQGARPAIPCLACHQIHAPATVAPALHLYDPRERTHVAAANLRVPHLFDGDRAVTVSLDVRQRLCLQCHAPNAAHQLGSSDDRTPSGVHEGLSCLDCHQTHARTTQASCSQCHPARSHCGLDVRLMDTTFLTKTSPHNIHTVACRDCHPAGIPGRPDSPVLP
jgi:hypothetical protein